MSLVLLDLKSLPIPRASTTQAEAMQASLPGSMGEPQLYNTAATQRQLGPDPVPWDVSLNSGFHPGSCEQRNCHPRTHLSAPVSHRA